MTITTAIAPTVTFLLKVTNSNFPAQGMRRASLACSEQASEDTCLLSLHQKKESINQQPGLLSVAMRSAVQLVWCGVVCADNMADSKPLEEASTALTQWLSPEHCGHLIVAVISKYIALTPEELQEWQASLPLSILPPQLHPDLTAPQLHPN